MKKIRNAVIAVLLLVAFTYTMTGCGISQSVKSPTLIQSVTIYWADTETGDWSEIESWEYAYEKGYPVSKLVTYADSGDTFETTFEYTFEGDIPVSMTSYGEGTKEYVSEYVDGRLSDRSQYFGDETSSRHQIYSYGNDDAFFTSVLHSAHVADVDPKSPSYNSEEIDTVMVTTENGLLKKTVNDGLYTNWLDGEDREWMRFNGTYTVDYDSMGIVSATSCEYRDDQTPVDLKFDVTMADGRVSEVIRKQIDTEHPEGANQYKYVFTYTDIPIDAARYSQMIDAHIMDAENNFYYYIWY